MYVHVKDALRTKLPRLMAQAAASLVLALSLTGPLSLALVQPAAASAAPSTAATSAAGSTAFVGQYFAQPVTPNPNQPGVCPKGACIIERYINPGIKVLAALAGIIIALSIILAGIQYTMSADDPQAVTAAKQRIFKSIMALIAFFFLFAFFNWIIPGGVGF